MTLLTNVSTNSTIDSTTWLLQFSLWPLRLFCPLLVVLCPVANWICVSIFQSSIYSRSSSKWYFIFIAIFDTIYVLVTAPLIFLLTLEIYILNWSIICCKIILFVNYLSCQISAGLLACLSIDRLLATTCLFLYRYNCTANVSKYVCLLVILMLSLINSHYLIGYTIDKNGFCTAKAYPWYEKIYPQLNVVYLLSYSIIPFTIITICNLFIVISVCQNKSAMKKKYYVKKPSMIINNPMEQTLTNLPSCYQATVYEKKRDSQLNEMRHQVSVTNNTSQVENKILQSDLDECDNVPSESLMPDQEETLNPIELRPVTIQQSISSVEHKRWFLSRSTSSSQAYPPRLVSYSVRCRTACQQL
ncbi:unnamed protein product [Adineta ricciae]|uniref:G-protein coupled receptors family 1 profile domain-containing protein n=1 Tax=Adineta ricciae TaxID=249248 RepID=A0A815A4F5_ADIRI|nr:unnamed protein product [Adineta ricciae]CAF1252232.1 unnamed protein product [Adineta ricciae]